MLFILKALDSALKCFKSLLLKLIEHKIAKANANGINRSKQILLI